MSPSRRYLVVCLFMEVTALPKVGKHFIADATAIEEACAGCRISYAINARNEVQLMAFIFLGD